MSLINKINKGSKRKNNCNSSLVNTATKGQRRNTRRMRPELQRHARPPWSSPKSIQPATTTLRKWTHNSKSRRTSATRTPNWSETKRARARSYTLKIAREKFFARRASNRILIIVNCQLINIITLIHQSPKSTSAITSTVQIWIPRRSKKPCHVRARSTRPPRALDSHFWESSLHLLSRWTAGSASSTLRHHPLYLYWLLPPVPG